MLPLVGRSPKRRKLISGQQVPPHTTRTSLRSSPEELLDVVHVSTIRTRILQGLSNATYLPPLTEIPDNRCLRAWNSSEIVKSSLGKVVVMVM